MEPTEESKKWHWMMQFCKDVGVSPADTYWWAKADREYIEHLKKKQEQQRHGAEGEK